MERDLGEPGVAWVGGTCACSKLGLVPPVWGGWAYLEAEAFVIVGSEPCSPSSEAGSVASESEHIRMESGDSVFMTL